jgi:hypothetical protein
MRSSQSGLFVIPFREGGIAPAQVNFTRQVAWDWVYQYEFTRSAPVLLGYGWNDERQVFSLKSQDSQHVTVRLDRPEADTQALARADGIYFYRYINVENIESPRKVAASVSCFSCQRRRSRYRSLAGVARLHCQWAISQAAVKTRSGQLVSRSSCRRPGAR